jgi:hypothetical protein
MKNGISIMCTSPGDASELKGRITGMQQFEGFTFSVATEKVWGYDLHRVIVSTSDLGKAELRELVDSFLLTTTILNSQVNA